MKYLIPLVLLFALCSCKDELKEYYVAPVEMVVCEDDCFEVNMVGRIVDLSDSSGVSQLPVTLEWGCFNYNYFGGINCISDSKTDDSGYFYFTDEIDSSRFKDDFYIYLNTPKRTDYYILSNDYEALCIEDCANDTIEFEFIAKTKLELNLDSVSGDSITYLRVRTFFCCNDFEDKYRTFYYSYTRDSNGIFEAEVDFEARGKSAAFTTAAGVPTIVELLTKIDGQNILYYDTISCTKDIVTNYKLTY